MNTYLFRNSNLLIFLFLLFIFGCSKDSSPTGPNTPSVGDIFPLVQNHALVFNRYEIDSQNNKISGTDQRNTLAFGPVTSIMGKSVTLVFDSVYYSNGALKGIDTMYFAKETDGTINELMLTTGISNSPIFVPFLQPSAGIGNVYNIITFDTALTYQGNTYHKSIKLTGVLNQKESVQVPAGSFSAYRFESTEMDSMKLGSQLVASLEIRQTYWLVDNVGPVKTFQTSSIPGNNNIVRELVSKNF